MSGAAVQPGVLHVVLERAYDLKDMDYIHKMVRSCADNVVHDPHLVFKHW